MSNVQIIDKDLLNNHMLTPEDARLITKARRHITEVNKTALYKYPMLTIEEFREVLSHRRSVQRYENGERGWQDQLAERPTPLWFSRMVLDWKSPLIYPPNMFD